MTTYPQTLVYKTAKNQTTADDVSISLDVYLPRQPHSAAPVPLIWVHTGGFLQGSRKLLPQHFIRACDRLNLALITPDYRLAPQVSLTDVLQDVVDSIRFTLSPEHLTAQLHGDVQLDRSRYILAGSSAGGWASLLLGLQLVDVGQPALPAPLAVLSIYPITTVSKERASYFHTPLRPLPFAYSLTAKVGEKVPIDSLKPHLDPQGPVLSEAPVTVLTSRAPLYAYARQEGIYADLVLRHKIDAASVCTPSLLAKRVPRAETKLIYVATGDADVHVEADQSEQVVEALKKVSGSFQLVSHVEPGKGHLWDILDTDADIPSLWAAIERVLKE